LGVLSPILHVMSVHHYVIQTGHHYLRIKLNTKANLSNGKGDNSITTENPVNSVWTIHSIQFLSFLCTYGQNQVRT
jgi:hypothetical protein